MSLDIQHPAHNNMNSNSNKVAWTLFFILIMSSSDFFLLVSAMICKDSQRQCVRNDSYCGDWNERLFIPVGNCPYRQLTAAQARQCLGDRTLVFIGDSQMRDLGVAVGLFLQGQTVHDSADVKFDKKRELIWQNCTKIGRFKSWGINNRPGDYNGFLFPKKDFSTEHPEEWKWQVQVWEIFYMIHQKCVRQVISNMMMKYNNDSMQLKKIDLAFWNHGLHDWHMWGTPPYGKKYYDAMVRPWIDMQLQLVVLSTPTVWVSMNNNCLGLMRHANMGIDLQFAMVEEVRVVPTYIIYILYIA